MFNEMIVVAVTPFSGSTSTDKNGKAPVMLQCIAGKMPNRNVMSGTVAERAGIEIGKTYLMQVREQGYDKVFGPDYTFIKIKELFTGADVAQTVKELSSPMVFTVERPKGFEEVYHRKTNAVEGLRNKRIHDGNYEPVSQSTSTDHDTADKVIQGSSITGDKRTELTPEDLAKALRGE